jgi:FkbM family methyltransferase
MFAHWLKSLINKLHKAAARSHWLTELALKVRNQSESVIGYALGEDAEVTDAGNSERWLISAVAREIRTFFDIGANRGDWTKVMIGCNPNALGCLCEPVGWCFDELQSRFGDDAKLHLFQVAVSNVIGRSRFTVMPGNAKTSSLFAEEKLGSEPLIDVNVVTVDGLVDQLGWGHIDFLKIDCEGFDLRVLMGSQNMLSAHRVGLIQFEYSSMWAMAGCTLGAALHFLHSLGYEVKLLRSNQLWQFEYGKWGEFGRLANFVAFQKGSIFDELIGRPLPSMEIGR